MKRPYRGRRDAMDKLLSPALIGVIIVAIIILAQIERSESSHVTPAETPSPITATAERVTEAVEVARIEIAEPPALAAMADEAKAEPEPTLTYIGKLQIYGYTPTCKHCCGKTNGVTASGVAAVVGRTVAMKGYPFGTEVYIDGLGYFVVEDRGVGKGVVDVACENHKACYATTSKRDVYIVERPT